jgi:hypothetical protein
MSLISKRCRPSASCRLGKHAQIDAQFLTVGARQKLLNDGVGLCRLASVNSFYDCRQVAKRGDLNMSVTAFRLRVEPYVDCDWRANVQRSQAPRKIFERGVLWQYKE